MVSKQPMANMSGAEPHQVPSRRKLPPLSQTGGESVSIDSTPRKKKKKSAAASDSPERDSPKRVLPKPAISARDLADSESNLESVRSVREVPPRPKPKRPKSSTGNATDTLQDIEGNDENPRPQKKKKSKSKIAGSQEQLIENGHVFSDEMLTDRSAPEKPKRKKKKKKTGTKESTGIGLETELQELEEDVVTEATDSFDENKYPVQTFMRSEPLNKLFIEQKGGFKAASKEKIARKRALNQQRQTVNMTEIAPTKSTIQFAISSQNIFRTVMLFVQGLLAGICMWQIITVYLLSLNGYETLLAEYKKLAMPVQCMYYFMLALSTVAVFDKNDIARPTKRYILRSLTMQTTAIACLFYLAGLVLSLSIANIDDRISQYDEANSPWEDEAARDSELKKWLILNLVRGLFPMLGWFVISISPASDRLIENLEKADENILGMVEPAEDDAVLRSSGV